MKLKDTLLKVLLVFVLASLAINLSSSAMNEAVIHPDIEKNTWSCFPSQSYNPPQVLESVLFNNSNSPSNQPYSRFLGYLFQIMFIFFFISPPLIAVILFLIWKELKERNKMK